MDSIEITINTGVNDLSRFALWRLFRSKLYWLYCGAAVIGATVLAKYLLDVIFISIFLMALPVSAVLGIVRRHLWKQIEKLKRHAVRLDPEGIRIVNEKTEVLYRWQKAMEIMEAKRYFFVTVGKSPVLVLHKYRLDQATIDNVRAFVTQKISEASGN